MSTYAYARVSTNKQADQLSTDAQFAMIKQQELNINKFVAEVGSAREPTKNLPKLINLLNTMKRGSTLWVHRFDRFSRSKLFALRWINKLTNRNIRIRSAFSSEQNVNTLTKTGQKQFLDIIKVAQAESDKRSTLTKEIFQAIRQAGGCTHQPPYGMQLTKNYKKRSREEIEEMVSNKRYKPPMRQLEVCPHQQPVVAIIRALRNGSRPLTEINRLLATVKPESANNPVVIYNLDMSTGNRTVATTLEGIDDEEIADILNERGITYTESHPEWTANIVRRLANDVRVVIDENILKPPTNNKPLPRRGMGKVSKLRPFVPINTLNDNPSPVPQAPKTRYARLVPMTEEELNIELDSISINSLTIANNSDLPKTNPNFKRT